MIRSILIIALVGSVSTQYVQQTSRVSNSQQQQSVQAAQPDAVDQIPAWYQMAKPVQAARVPQPMPQASPSYYERLEPTYEQRREQAPTYERPGIQTNQYANYPSYSNRQPYENLNALTSGASLSNLQANRRYPSAAASSGSDMPYDSALKRYHKLLLKRRQWTTKIGRILASTTPMTPSTTASTTTSTTTPAPTTTTKKMPKSLKSIYSTINPRTTTEEQTSTEASTTTTRPKVTPRIVGKPRGTFKPHGTRKGWRMWKKVTPKYVAKLSTTTTEDPITSTILTTDPNTSSHSSSEAPSTTTSISTTSTSTTTSEPAIPELPLIEEEQEITTTEEPTSTEKPTSTTEEATTTTTSETTTTKEEKLKSRYICQHKAGSNEHDPFAERRASTMAPFRPIAVGHKWKPLRFKKPEPAEVTTIPEGIATRPRGLRLLEYLLKQTDTFAKGLQKAIDGVSASGVNSPSLTNEPNTELLAAIKDVVAKFKASLDEAGIDQDVRLMGNQLKNTWQQLRTGLDRGMKAVRQSAESSVTNFNYGPQPQPVQPVQIPYRQHRAPVHRYTTGPMNEQIGRLFEKAVADAADQKQAEQLQQIAGIN